jgi:hypothetical protein
MRIQIKNTTIFGTLIGFDKKGKAIIVEEETNKLKKYSKSRIVKSYNKGQ